MIRICGTCLAAAAVDGTSHCESCNNSRIRHPLIVGGKPKAPQRRTPPGQDLNAMLAALTEEEVAAC
jgi:hypothetical protein